MLTVIQRLLATEFFKMNKNCCLNELKSTAYINVYAREINVRVYILIHIFIRFIIKIHLFIYNQTNFKGSF